MVTGPRAEKRCSGCGVPCGRSLRCRTCFSATRHEAASAPEIVEARFRQRFTQGAPDECWVWQGALHKGYGIMRVAGHQRPVHRVAWELEHGPIPDGLVIDHLCRNRACVNTAHMELVTPGENVLRGEAPPAVYARRTHCIHGHPFAGENLKLGTRDGRPIRICRACKRRQRRERAVRSPA